MAKNEQLEKAPAPGALERPDWAPASNWGMEEATMRDMLIPRLGLCQTNSKARIKTEARYIKGLEEGQFYNSLTKKNYGEKLQVIPLFFYKSRIMFRDMKQGGGIICQAPDGVHCQLNAGGPCLHQTWGKSGEPPECTEFFNYPAYVFNGDMVNMPNDFVILSLKTTGMEAGKTINSLIRLRGGVPFITIFEVESTPDTDKAGNNYFTWSARYAEPHATINRDWYGKLEEVAKTTREGLKAGTIVVDSDDEFATRDEEV